MKNKRIVLIGLIGSFALSGCGLFGNKKEEANDTYNLIFHQDNVADTIVTVTRHVTTNDDVKDQEPKITEREGYTAVWAYDITQYTEDTIISPTYTAITYYATFKANGRQVGNPLPFTVEDTRVPNEPTVPVVTGYEGKWQDYTIKAADMTITEQYEIKSSDITWSSIVAGTSATGTATICGSSRTITSVS